jgi:hypothetical protein
MLISIVEISPSLSALLPCCLVAADVSSKLFRVDEKKKDITISAHEWAMNRRYVRN